MTDRPPVSRGAMIAAGAVAVSLGVAAVVTHPVSRSPAPQPAPVVAPQYPPGVLPNLALTPGATLPVTREQVLTHGYSATVRHTPESLKAAVIAEYGFDPKHHPPGEVDHLIPLSWGGADEKADLWFELQDVPGSPWGFRQKDALEVEVLRELRAGTLDLKQSQDAIRSDWVAFYKRVFHTDQPLPAHARPLAEKAD